MQSHWVEATRIDMHEKYARTRCLLYGASSGINLLERVIVIEKA
jgi:hypothetical protein